MYHYRIRKSGSIAVAVTEFRDEVQRWAEACLERYGEAEPTDNWDQALYLVGWMPVLELEPASPLLNWLCRVRDDISRHAHKHGHWHHGYWKQLPVSHGLMHFETFLGALWKLHPEDTETVRQYLDATEHLLGPVDDVPAWFDYESCLFPASSFGSGGPMEGDTGLNLPHHFRAINAALLAFQMGGGKAYLDMAALYGCHWCDAILDGKDLPLALSANGPVFSHTPELALAFAQLGIVMLPKDCPVARAEAFLAADGIRALLKLWQFTEEEAFRHAAERLIETLLPELSDPEAGALAAAIRHYRDYTGSPRYDAHVLYEAEVSFPYWIDQLGVDTERFRKARPGGVGKRADLPFWFENGMVRQHSPILLGLAAEITGNERLATWALDLAHGYFRLARMAFPDGREQGNSARSVSAVAAGHGRDCHAGMVTEVLRPYLRMQSLGTY